MTDFQTHTTVRSRKARCCPECRAEIGIGQSYRREVGRYDGNFYSAIMCEPCGGFMDRYVASMQNASFLNWDEVTFTFGGIIDEAAEYIGYERASGERLPVTRDAVLALFDEFDEDERECRRREVKQRKEAVHRQAQYAADIARRMYASPSPLAPRMAGGV